VTRAIRYVICALAIPAFLLAAPFIALLLADEALERKERR